MPFTNCAKIILRLSLFNFMKTMFVEQRVNGAVHLYNVIGSRGLEDRRVQDVGSAARAREENLVLPSGLRRPFSSLLLAPR